MTRNKNTLHIDVETPAYQASCERDKPVFQRFLPKKTRLRDSRQPH